MDETNDLERLRKKSMKQPRAKSPLGLPQESAINQDSQFNPNCDINLDMTDLGL